MKAELLDRVRYVILKAPDRFPADTGMTLDKAFLKMKEATVSLSLENVIGKHLDLAYENYRCGNVGDAIKSMQVVESILVGRLSFGGIPNS